MQYDPKLKKAMQEIQKVLNKYDIGGTIILHRPGFIEFMNKINPGYSCMSFKQLQGGMGIHIKAKKADYGSSEARDLAIAQTANMLHNVVHIMGAQWITWDEMLKTWESHIGKHEHNGPGEITSHETQNN